MELGKEGISQLNIFVTVTASSPTEMLPLV